ncbi:hypothetical protein F8M41_023662 [Gigaspora margarita]|uniref:BZIP domain-containing protein n=1 Tax=Gigaspora margarita TaxID=4874 RepID=A0A8H4ACZ2_GIGMA|nr:hypothetical protein F8M41_023662 [Gigaspora margarita]
MEGEFSALHDTFIEFSVLSPEDTTSQYSLNEFSVLSPENTTTEATFHVDSPISTPLSVNANLYPAPGDYVASPGDMLRMNYLEPSPATGFYVNNFGFSSGNMTSLEDRSANNEKKERKKAANQRHAVKKSEELKNLRNEVKSLREENSKLIIKEFMGFFKFFGNKIDQLEDL